MNWIFVGWIKGHPSYAKIWNTIIVYENPTFLGISNEILGDNLEGPTRKRRPRTLARTHGIWTLRSTRVDPKTEDPKEDPITEETKKNFIMKDPKQDLKEDSITEAH